MTEPLHAVPGGDAAAIIDAATRAVTVQTVNPNHPQIVVVPQGATVAALDLTAWREQPTRKTGVYQPATVDAFVAYVEQHADPDRATVWVHPTSGRVVAIIDDNAVTEPGWRQHKAVLQLETTPEWDHWAGRDGEMCGQETFAEHIEIGMTDIEEPDGADVLELAQTFYATSSSVFRQATRLQSGATQFQYDEEVKASAGVSGRMEIPQVIKLGIAPFIGEHAYAVIARLRYRLTGGHLQLGYKLDRPELVKRDAIEQIAEKLAGTFPLTYVGSEPTA